MLHFENPHSKRKPKTKPLTSSAPLALIALLPLASGFLFLGSVVLRTGTAGRLGAVEGAAEVGRAERGRPPVTPSWDLGVCGLGV